MPLACIRIPSMGCEVSRLVGNPSSADPRTHHAGLDAFHRGGGNAIYLHGEGEETHSRIETGRWLAENRLRDQFMIQTVICHDGWDEARQLPINRFHAEGVTQDIDRDLRLIGIDTIDLLCLGDHPPSPIAPVIEQIAREIEAGRSRGYTLSNFSADRLAEVLDLSQTNGRPKPVGIVTTELSHAVADAPLWQEYIPFDTIEPLVQQHGLCVFAHIGDLTLGQCLFGDEDEFARLRPNWISRWNLDRNAAIVSGVRQLAVERNLTTRQINLAATLTRPYPVVGIVNLSNTPSQRGAELFEAAGIAFTDDELETLRIER